LSHHQSWRGLQARSSLNTPTAKRQRLTDDDWKDSRGQNDRLQVVPDAVYNNFPDPNDNGYSRLPPNGTKQGYYRVANVSACWDTLNGYLYVVCMDNRQGKSITTPGADLWTVFHAYSKDGGRTLSQEPRVVSHDYIAGGNGRPTTNALYEPSGDYLECTADHQYIHISCLEAVQTTQGRNMARFSSAG
jgi:hypothetical protein